MKPFRFWFSLSFFVLACSFPVFGQALGDALNAPDLTWSTSGTYGVSGWSAETSNTHDGSSAAMSGTIMGSGSSILETTLNGPGTLTFWWSSPSYMNTLSFTSSNTALSLMSQSNWQQQTVYLGSGSQNVRWTYAKGPALDTISRGYLDEVSYTPGAVGPIISLQPRSQSQVAGFPVTFRVAPGGTPPLSYQWRFNTEEIPGATTSSYTVTNVDSSTVGAYTVLITNNVALLSSSNAVLELGELTAWGSSLLDATAVPSGATNLLAIDAGDYDGLMLRSDGTVAAWGKNTLGETTCPDGLTNLIAIAAGSWHCLALKADGTVVGWGDNRYGQTNVPAGLSDVVAIAGGASHSLALLADGTVAAWGGNPYNAYSETNVPPGLSNVIGIAANSYSLALTADGTVTGWGGGPRVPANLSNVVAIAAGDSHALALLADGTVAAWGQNYAGQTNVPVGLTNVVAVAAGAAHSLALGADGKVAGWGMHLNDPGNPIAPPRLTNAVAIAAGTDHDLALVGRPSQLLHASITAVSVSADALNLSIASRSGRVYALQSADSLSAPNWTTVRLLAGNGAALTLTQQTAGPQRFYRVLRW
ncbi:MAG TPA: hypothetical protein VJA21_23215 [Verrucomicrobiae bacterium]